jgi:hypothetical protein
MWKIATKIGRAPARKITKEFSSNEINNVGERENALKTPLKS